MELGFCSSQNIQSSEIHTAKLYKIYTTREKICKKQKFYQQYAEFIEEYKTLGHMKPVSVQFKDTQEKYFLPHHAIMKERATLLNLE